MRYSNLLAALLVALMGVLVAAVADELSGILFKGRSAKRLLLAALLLVYFGVMLSIGFYK